MINHKVLGLIGLCMKSGGVVFGTDACMEAIQNHKVKLVIVAEDAAQRTKRHFEEACRSKQIPVYFGTKISELSKAIGKPNKAVLGIRNQNFAKAIKQIIDGGESIG